MTILCRRSLFTLICLLSPTAMVAAEPAAVRFQRALLSEQFFSEGAAVGDINGDGVKDIVSGPFWYKGPTFRERVPYTTLPPPAIAGYSKHFFTWTADLNEDQKLDILIVGMPGEPAHWFENPGKERAGDWKKRLALTDVGGESPEFTDVNDDHKPELVCAHNGRFGYAQFDPAQPEKPWSFTAMTPDRRLGRFTHGMGVGDVDGDGRQDLLETNGWWRQTDKPNGLFEFHEVKFAQSGGAQMFAYDFDGDGDNDVISVQNAHGWGLTWFERRGDGADLLFVPHKISTELRKDNPYSLAISQMHGVALADVDGDGVKDLITGKRFWAHGGRDPGAQQLPLLVWFRTVRTPGGVRFEPHLIDHRLGVGTQVTVGDLNDDGRNDLVIGSKLGTYALVNQKADGKPVDQQSAFTHAAGTPVFRENIRSTDPQSPEQERRSFVLPPGFEIQLVAAEPQIAKPMNMAFDERGRLWVSSSEEYPIAAPDDRKPKDTIKILEDTNGDGRADKVTTFADGLNIPIGLYPYQDGVICFSIPNILFLRDTDGDGRADKREKLYGPFDTSRDTHGMCNAFTPGLDGWLYACHGFSNQSRVAGADGHEVVLKSGNTFRIKLDGSRIEHFGRGQVNPFGMTFDWLGDMLTADCHTKPINLVLKGGYHDSFGAPHDGLGFVPNVLNHLHGSTGIAGIALGRSTGFPAIYETSTFGGNVVTSRINRNSLHYDGSTVRAQEEADFLVAGDPWFRPVDVQVGPDGALYIADFYNRIIGHYEVKIDHPGRDRHRGRIWRVAYTGKDDRRDAGPHIPKWEPMPTAGKSNLNGLLQQLRSPNQARRVLAANRIVEAFGDRAVAATRTLFQQSPDANGRVQALWILFRLEAMSGALMLQAIDDESPTVRVHAFRALSEWKDAPAGAASWLMTGFADRSPIVQRAAVMAAIDHASPSLVVPLLEAFERTPANDLHLKHAIRMALKTHLSNEQWFRQAKERFPKHVDLVASVCLALSNEAAGEFIAQHIANLASPEMGDAQLARYLSFAAAYATPETVERVVEAARARYQNDTRSQLRLLESMKSGLEKRGVKTPQAVREWALSMAVALLDLDDDLRLSNNQTAPLSWAFLPAPGTPGRGNPWVISTRRKQADGRQQAPLFSSFPKGEQWTGIYRSQPFELSDSFSFYVAGHDGFPDKPLQHRNLVRLRLADSHDVIRKSPPPRNDTAQRVEWATEAWRGKRAYVELVDGDTASAFAWLAVGRFSHSPLNPSRLAEDRRLAAGLMGRFRLTELSEPLSQLARQSTTDGQTRAALLEAFVALKPDSRLAALAQTPTIAGLDRKTRTRALDAVFKRDATHAAELIAATMAVANAGGQRRLAEALSGDLRGSELLIANIESGRAAAHLLTRPRIQQKLVAVADKELVDRAKAILSELPSENKQLVELIKTRVADYLSQAGSRQAGEELFRKNCAICHQVASKGSKVGPNLDGIGNRGLNRLAEDVLAPNRNVDVAFRSTILVTSEGNVLTGLLKENGGRLTLIDSKGKELPIDKDAIDQRKNSTLSPMPTNVGESLTVEQFRHLMAYLLSLR